MKYSDLELVMGIVDRNYKEINLLSSKINDIRWSNFELRMRLARAKAKAE